MRGGERTGGSPNTRRTAPASKENSAPREKGEGAGGPQSPSAPWGGGGGGTRYWGVSNPCSPPSRGVPCPLPTPSHGVSSPPNLGCLGSLGSIVPPAPRTPPQGLTTASGPSSPSVELALSRRREREGRWRRPLARSRARAFCRLLSRRGVSGTTAVKSGGERETGAERERERRTDGRGGMGGEGGRDGWTGREKEDGDGWVEGWMDGWGQGDTREGWLEGWMDM